MVSEPPASLMGVVSEQVFCACWADDQTVVSGGADSKLHFFTAKA